MAFFRDRPGDLLPEENFWTLWCKGRLTEADTLTIRLGTTPFGLISAQVYTLFNTVYAFVTWRIAFTYLQPSCMRGCLQEFVSIGLSSICGDGDTVESYHVTSLLNATNSLLQRFRRCAKSRDELQERWTLCSFRWRPDRSPQLSGILPSVTLFMALPQWPCSEQLQIRIIFV